MFRVDDNPGKKPAEASGRRVYFGLLSDPEDGSDMYFPYVSELHYVTTQNSRNCNRWDTKE
jgi:hypothetical protein